MKLSNEELKSITSGAAYTDSVEERTVFHRFTKEQEIFYKADAPDFSNKIYSNSGIRLEFRTDSTSLFIKALLTQRTSRNYYSFEVFVNREKAGVLRGQLRDEAVAGEKGIKVAGEFKLGESKEMKDVCVFLPWSFSADIEEISVDDGSIVAPINRTKKIIMYGDSITQGYNTAFTCNSYASRLAIMLDAETRNKGIGAEIFRPGLAKIKDDDFEADIITVAYGTNDWAGNISKELFDERSDDFYSALSENYPNAKIFAISPIWRADFKDAHEMGEFLEIKNQIKNIANKYENVIYLDGFDFVPHRKELYQDEFLHPNDEGFEYYAQALVNEINKYL